MHARGFSSCFAAGSRTHTLLQLLVVRRCFCTGTQSDRSPTAPKKLRHADTCKSSSSSSGGGGGGTNSHSL
jgi:hypothetical protein